MTRRFLTVSLALIAGPVVAADYQDSEQIAPESAADASVGLERMEKQRPLAPARTVLQDLLKDASPYWRDTEVTFRIRAFDFSRENDEITLSEATAAGFELAGQSGKWRDAFSVHASWHTSYGTDAPEGLGGTGVLAPDQSDLSVISRAFAQWDFNDEDRVRLYRQDFNMPYLNRQDSRMIPTTHEAYVYQHAGKRWQAVAGQVTKVKRRESDQFVHMGEVAGVPGNKNGTSVLGLQYEFPSSLKFGAVAQHTHDLFATTYSETSYGKTWNENWSLQLAAQLTNQWSVGSELLGDFNTYSWGLRGNVSYRGAVLTIAGSRIGSAAIQSRFGGSPGYTVSMIENFDRARERAWRIGLSQNLAAYGVPGISLTLRITDGTNAVSNSGAALEDTTEFDVTADFRPEKGLLKGLWLRIRYGEVDRGSPQLNRRDVRVIINYSLSAFQ